jgi:hypothetical protein
MEGCIGLSMLVDRNTGRCVATSAWRTREAMFASERQLRPVRDHVAEILGNRPQVDEWEIAVLHRDHTSGPGACVRASWVRMAPAQADRVVDVYRMGLLPVMQDYDGFCSASLLVDRASGLAVSSVSYDSLESMQRSREKSDALREAGAREAGVEIVEVCEFELTLAHLRVPEMT